MRNQLEHAVILVARALARGAPVRLQRVLGRGFGRVVHALGLRVEVARANVHRALGDALSPEACERVVRGAYESFGVTFMELLALSRARARRAAESATWLGFEHLDAALAAGRGAVVASAHYGNWEVLGAAAAARGYPVTFVVQRLRNPAADRLLTRLRQGAGVRVLERGMALRNLGAEFAANRIVCIMGDQDARRRGVFLPLFGHPASTHKGPAQIALRHRVPLLAGMARRQADGTYCMAVEPLALPDEALPSAEDAALHALLQRYQHWLERTIRADPTQYLWQHRRWKTAPPAAAPCAADGRPPAPAQVRPRRQAST